MQAIGLTKDARELLSFLCPIDVLSSVLILRFPGCFFFYYCICDTTGFYARITFVHCQPNGTGQEKDYEFFRHDLQGAYTNEFLNMNDDISIFFNDKK